jgi:drug/metabolite transporter (DMT)-like permease
VRSAPTPPAAVLAPERAPSAARAGHLALLVVQLVFGLFPVLVKLAVEGGLEPRAIAAWRLVFGSVSVGAVALLLHRRAALPPRRLLPRLVLCSLLGVFANQLLALEGTARTSAASAGLLMTMIPVFTFLVAALARQERFAPRQLVGVPIAMAGALWLLLSAESSGAAGPAPLLGNALIVLNTLAYAGYLVLSRRLLRELPPAVLLAWAYLLSLPAAPFLAHGQALLPDAVDLAARTDGWWGLALLLVGPTFLAYLLNTFALSRVPASVTAIYIYLQPAVAATAANLVLGEALGPDLAISAALVFVGIANVTLGRRRS